MDEDSRLMILAVAFLIALENWERPQWPPAANSFERGA